MLSAAAGLHIFGAMSASGKDQLALPLTEFAIVDIETTGTIHDGKITEIAIIVHDGEKELERFTTLLNPGRKIDRYVVKLTGITDRMVADAPLFQEHADRILEMTRDRVFVAHNVSFDYGFLKMEFAAIGVAFKRETLDTIDICRRIIPGLPSYSLGKLCRSLGIEMDSHHRALDDTAATATLFQMLFQKDAKTVFSRIKPDIPNVKLPPNLPPSDLEQLPSAPGVYYFYDEEDELLYIGKSVNVKKRVLSHFHPREKRKWAKLWKGVHSISFEETGSELVALLLESAEIKKLQPPINRALKKPYFPFGIYEWTDKQGYLNLRVQHLRKSEEALIELKTFSQGKRLLLSQAKKHDLCQCLLGLHKIKGNCFHHQIDNCRGAKMEKEPPAEYNPRVQKAKSAFGMEMQHVLIIGKGRHADEYSMVQIEGGRYRGFGFMDRDMSHQPLDAMIDCITSQRDDPDARKLIRGFLNGKHGHRIVRYEKTAENEREFIS